MSHASPLGLSHVLRPPYCGGSRRHGMVSHDRKLVGIACPCWRREKSHSRRTLIWYFGAYRRPPRRYGRLGYDCHFRGAPFQTRHCPTTPSYKKKSNGLRHFSERISSGRYLSRLTQTRLELHGGLNRRRPSPSLRSRSRIFGLRQFNS